MGCVRKWSKRDIAKMAQLKAEGKTLEEIGWAFGGIAPSRVHKLLESARKDELREWLESLPVGTVIDLERRTIIYPAGVKSRVT